MYPKFQKTRLVHFTRISAILTLFLFVLGIGAQPVIASPRTGSLSGWANKIPITITNTGAALTDYQVQVNLDTGNFNFSQANSDGSDIRFTAADGNTLLPFWIETWNPGRNATVWVKVPALPAGENVMIYLHAGNPAATTSTSDGASTFYFFESFEGSPWTGWTHGSGSGTFTQSTDQARRGSYSGKLVTTTPGDPTVFSKASSLPGTNFVQEWDLYDDLNSPAFKVVRANYSIPGGQIGLGVWTGSSTTEYAYHDADYGYTPTTAARTTGWHKMAIQVTSDGKAEFFVDSSTTLGTVSGLPGTFNQVSVEGIPEGPTTFYVDDVRVRKYASPAPMVTVGLEGQPAVEMASNLANDINATTTLAGDSLVYVVIAIDTEADNNHPMGTLHTTFDVHNYRRVGSVACPRFVSKYSETGSSWNSYADGTAFNFKVLATSQTEPATSFACGYNNSYGLDDYAQAVRFTVPSNGNYNVQVQLSVTGNPPDTNIYVVPDLGGNPDIAHPLSTYTARASSVINGSYTVIGSNLSLETDVYYWWVANRQASGDDNNRFAVYQGVRSGSNTFSRIMDPSFRNSIVDSDGHPFKMSWFMEMDNFINNGLYADGRPMNYLTLYNELMNNWGAEVRSYGDEIAYHHHFMYWDGSQWIASGHQHATDGQYEQHNHALNHMVLDAQFFPTNFRAGWLNNDNQLQAWVEKWMLADVGGAGWGGTGWSPYHPSSTDFTQVGNMNHWIANCPSSPSQEGVDSAFDQAVEENKAVLLCWYMHQRDDMRGLVASADTYLQNASSATGIPFKYVTAKEAMQAIIGATDTTPPVLSVTRSTSNKYTITSNESLWGSGPYVAARYGEGSGAIYQRYATTYVKTRTWRANIPATNGGLSLRQVGAGALDLSGNSAVAFYIASQPPVAVADAYTTPEDTILSIAAPGVLANDTNANPTKPLSAIMVTAPGHGSVILNTSGSFTYTPGTDWIGSDSFTYKANDGTLDSNVATVSITVNAVGGSPVLDPIGNKTVEAGSLLGFTATASDDDPGALLSFTLRGQPAGATITSGGVFSWTPTGTQSPGTYTFDVCVSDGSLSDCETITVTVTSTGTSVSVTVQLLDSSGAPLTGSVQYYDGSWKTFGSGTTPTSMALLSQTYIFRVSYAGATVQKSQNVAGNPVVSFQTGKVVSASGTATQYYTGVWRPFTNGMELLPRTYTFSFSGGVSNLQYRIIAGTTNTIY